jgi:signal peptidase II
MKKIFAVGILFILFVLDRFLKFTALELRGFFIIRSAFGAGFGVVKNFGIGFHISLPSYITIFFTVVILGIITWQMYRLLAVKSEGIIFSLPFFSRGFILAGGLSNLFDRIAYGYVVDYLSFYLKNDGFAFNIADVLIAMGSGMLLLMWSRKRVRYEF